MPTKTLQFGRVIQAGPARIQKRSGRGVNIDQDCAELPTCQGRIKPLIPGSHCKKIFLNQSTARIIGQGPAHRQDDRLVPLDDRLQKLDHQQAFNR